jgi:phosphoenolpyruvate synthase/pyruvate phosphate dikinase
MGQIKNEGRNFMNYIFFGANAILPSLLKNLSSRFDVSENNLQQYSRKEILTLFDGEKVSESEVEKREDAFYVLGKDGGTIIEVGQKARENIEQFLTEEEDTEKRVLKGVVANRGSAQGRAVVFKYSYDNFDAILKLIDDVKSGDIIVAETTSPEFMPACRKAAGIITDQGGMLSHAAIVSRELGIPCLVAVTNASEIIKTGDVVEVDADNGVVRKLS